MDHSYCYICQKDRPCAENAPCQTLKGPAKTQAYNAGYRLMHPEKYAAFSLAHYRKSHPAARDMAVVKSEAATKRNNAQVQQRRRRLLLLIEQTATEVRQMLYRKMVTDWQAAFSREQTEIRKAEVAAYYKNVTAISTAVKQRENTRKDAHTERMIQAEAHYQECLQILATYNSPGGGRVNGYPSPESARAARKAYKRAHATVFARTPAGRAYSRNQDAAKRLASKGIRNRRGAGVGDFYRRMITEPQICFYCDKPLAPSQRVGDHFIPLAKGGEHAAHNLVVSCAVCNGKKRDTPPMEFLDGAWAS